MLPKNLDLWAWNQGMQSATPRLTVCWQPYCITKQFWSCRYHKTLFQEIWIHKAVPLDQHVIKSMILTCANQQ